MKCSTLVLCSTSVLLCAVQSRYGASAPARLNGTPAVNRMHPFPNAMRAHALAHQSPSVPRAAPELFGGPRTRASRKSTASGPSTHGSSTRSDSQTVVPGASPAEEEIHSSPRSDGVSNSRTLLETPSAYTSFRNVLPLREFREQYSDIIADQRDDTRSVRVGGRITSMRHMGRILFLTLASGGEQLQVIRQVTEQFTKGDLKKLMGTLRTGDIIGAEGVPGRTKKGELSLYASSLILLVPYVCTDQSLCPNLRGFGLVKDAEIKYRYRFVDLMTNPDVMGHFTKRHTMIKALRGYLEEAHFVEVETPILHSVASGANAKPFITRHNANEMDLYLRVAPELYLKQCVVGGMERVFEIGRVFRNEDADRSHNPEFTSCELYAAYHTYEDLIPMTESILRHMAQQVNGTSVVTVTSCVTGEPVEIDLNQSFRRVSAYDEIQRAAGVELPSPIELNTPRGLAYMAAIMLRWNVPLPPIRTASKMFDKLIEYFITDHVVEPTFVMDHPVFMSPLAKEHSSRPGLSERFELFINGTEYCNAYSELNDPQEQFRRLEQQLLDKCCGDDEAMPMDETFLKALQVGMPPTAGWGMGVDRVSMLLNGSSTIREDILFPLLRPDMVSHDAKRRRKTASFFGFNHHMTLFCLNALEGEMVKRQLPTEATEKVRQLRRCIVNMGQQAEKHSLHDSSCEGMNRWAFEVTMAIMKIFCGRHNW